ncbi:hydrophobin family protein [Actinosynnema sp. NPDC023658]|uniref:hydrophobin family protein n=1 Tax=Actinosynnema sp. NPDC023658 TaxID=3155465 RepID=UPI00340384CD
MTLNRIRAAALTAALTFAATAATVTFATTAHAAPGDITQTCNAVLAGNHPAGQTIFAMLPINDVGPDTLVGLTCTPGKGNGIVVCGPFNYNGIVSVPVRPGAC